MVLFHRGSSKFQVPSSKSQVVLGDRQKLGDYAGQLRAIQPDVVVDLILSSGRLYNVGEAESITELEWAQRIAAAMAWSGRFIVLPRDRTPPHLVMPGNVDQHWTIDTSRIREELGYREPIAQDEAIRRTIAWERANPGASSPHAFDYAAEDIAGGTT